MDQMSHQASAERTTSNPAGNDAIPRVSSKELMRHQPQLIIEHEGREYRLRITNNGKLILTA